MQSFPSSSQTHQTGSPSTAFSVSEPLLGPIITFGQLGGTGEVSNKALIIPVHHGGPWNSVELVRLAADASVGEHKQDTDEIYYLLSGRGILTTNGKEEAVQAGSLVLAPRGTVHSLCNTEAAPLSMLVIELRVLEARQAEQCAAKTLPSVPALLAEGTWHKATGSLHVASVDLASAFAAPWNKLSLVELPAGTPTVTYTEADCDEFLLVLSGCATFVLDGQVHHSRDDGLSALVSCGVPRSITRRASVDPLRLLSVTVGRQPLGRR